MWGIDVSHHQGKIDWKAVANDGVQYAIMKVMYEKTHAVDEQFQRNYSQCGLYGLERGAYLYVIATNADQAYSEVRDFINLIRNKQFERGVWLDMEDHRIRNIGEVNLIEIIKIEATLLKANGYSVGIYTNVDWYQNVVNGNMMSSIYPWWIARYPKNDQGDIKMMLKPNQKGVEMWQYSSKGSVAGIAGPVDLDYDMADLGLDAKQVAIQVISGKWGNGEVRRRRLEAAGYDFTLIQQVVMQIMHNTKFYPQYTGSSMRIDAVFSDIGVEDIYIGNKVNRKPVAIANGIPDYRGTLIQNLKLISLARSGDLRRP